MTAKFLSPALICALLSCAQKNANENQNSSVEVQKDSIVVPQPVTSKEPVTDVPKVQELQLTQANLTAFTFSTAFGHELTFTSGGKVILTRQTDESRKNGFYKTSEGVIEIAMGVDTVSYEIGVLTEDGLQLTTQNEVAADLFGVTVRGEDRRFYINLYRITFSAPYSEEQISGGWQVSGGASSFGTDGMFSHSEPDCSATGTWTLDGDNLTIVVTDKSQCDVAFTSGRLKVIRLSRNFAVLQAEDFHLEFWRRS